MSQAPSLIRRIDDSGIPLLLARLYVGGMFGYLAIMKLLDPLDFVKQLHLYNVLPTQPTELVNGSAAVLPWLELLCALALLLGVGLRGAAGLVTGMLLFFYPLLILRALGIYATEHPAAFCDVRFNCGCGTGDVFICRKLAENLSLSLLALIPLFSQCRRFCLAALFQKRDARLPASALAVAVEPRKA